VELAAIIYVKRWLEKQGVKTRDADSEGCDLITEVGEDVHSVEVKGSSHSKSPIMVCKSIFEFLEKEDVSLKYFIYIVSDIESEPKLRIITPEMQKWQEKKICVLENQSFKDATVLPRNAFKSAVEGQGQQ
jgi:hypothetical protein